MVSSCRGRQRQRGRRTDDLECGLDGFGAGGAMLCRLDGVGSSPRDRSQGMNRRLDRLTASHGMSLWVGEWALKWVSEISGLSVTVSSV